MTRRRLGRGILTSLSHGPLSVPFLLIVGLFLTFALFSVPDSRALGGSIGQAAFSQTGQKGAVVVGGSGPVIDDSRPRTISNTPTAGVSDHRTTGDEPAGNCTPPTIKTRFAPTDSRVYQWTLFSGAVAGDSVRWDFRKPDGTSYFLTDPVAITFNGDVCAWGFINIATSPAAALLGNWEVRVIYNGSVVTTDSFTLRSDTVVLTDHRITGPAPTGCTPPASKTTFLPTDPSVYQWTRVNGAQVGDQVRWEFVQPNGSVYATSSTLTISLAGDNCFWVGINIAGHPAATLLGTWQIRVIYNNVPLLPTPDTFTIAQNLCPTLGGINPTSGVIGSSVTISGTNLTGVNSVKFANNVSASFVVNNDTTIIASVPNAAVAGPITISKPSCADLQTSSYTVILRPVIEVTAASLNFGTVIAGERASLPLTVRNIGNAPLSISSITSTNPQFTISLPTRAFALIPGGSVAINVSFTADSAGTKTATLSINNSDPTRPRVDVAMTGTGLAPAIEVTPATLSFGDLKLAQTRDLSFAIRNTGGALLKVNGVTSSNAQFGAMQLIEKPSNAVRSLPLAIAPGAIVEVTVRFRPSFVASSVGTQSGVLSIDSNDPTRPRLDVPLNGRGLGALVGSPSTLAFGSASVCSPPTTAGLTLTNTGNESLTISSISTDHPAFTVMPKPGLPLSIAAGVSLSLTLSFSTSTTGGQIGRLLVSSNAVNNPGLSVSLTGVGTAIPPPVIGQLSVSRTTLSHGRVDTARAVSPFNPFGLADVIGFAFAGAPLPANSIAPGVLPPALIGGFPGQAPAAIPSAPDPFRITLVGGLANPIVLAAANIPSCFTLVVAEGVTAPNLTRWDRIGTRFGSGNVYAAVAIPGTAISAGVELVTEADFEAYTANSIIYEAPDFGLLVAPAGQNGGTSTFQARARRIPAGPQCQAVLSQPQSTQVEFSRTVRIEIDTNRTVMTRVGTGIDVTVTAQILGNFDPAINTVVRWAYDGNTLDQVIDRADMTLPGGARVVMQTFHAPAADECKLAQITAVASSTGNVPAVFLPPINPFLALAPDSIGLFTFRSGGSTVEDTKTVLVRAPDSDCGGGVPVGWIRGVVTSAATGEVLAGATVTVAGTSITETTGDDGTYELNNVPAGVQTLSASAAGFETRQLQINVFGGQILTQDISLFPQSGTIGGLVIDAFSYQPIVGATVAVKGTGIAATSGSGGSYTLSNVPIGPQTVTASASGSNPDQSIVNVIADQTVGEDFFLTPVTGTVTGTVRNATTNQPIAGATVTAASAGLSATTGSDGSYTLNNVPAGPQTLNATANGFNPASISGSVLAGMTVRADVAMMPLLGIITGTVRNADNADPVSGATITVGGTGLSTASDAGGNYALINVPAGSQTLNASANGFMTTQSSGINVVGNETVVRDVTLTPLKGKIQGKITNATNTNPIANADVEVLPFPITFATSDAGGNYTLANVPTGQQVILASAPGYYAKLAVVNVVADQTSTQDFALTPKVGVVLGTVFDNFSQVVADATVAVAGTNIAATTDSNGTYTLTNVQEGTQTLNVSKLLLDSAQATVNVVGNETIYKDIYLQTPTGTVRGTVKNAANNQPIVGAQILVGIPFGVVYYSAFTDGNGNYALNDIPVGSLTVYVGAEGFIAQQATTSIVFNQTKTLDFALTPVTATTTGTITGTVKSTAANNPPVAGAAIIVAGTNLSTTSGGDGSYALSNVPAGAQTLNVSRTAFRSATAQVTVTGGQNVTLNISLIPSTGTVTGTIRNAQTGDPLVGATITVSGTGLATTSAAGGTYTFNDVPSGAQTLSASGSGFTATQVPVNVTEGQTVTVNISLSPTLPPGEMRITLNWTKDGAAQPRDLDAHLAGPNPDGSSCFHVYYNNRGNLSAAPFAQLEVDNISISGAPPLETIRISKLAPGIYRFYVINFRNEEPAGLSGSRATVQIFGATSGPTSFTVPGGSGQSWTVFEINGQTGAITAINQLVSPAGNCR